MDFVIRFTENLRPNQSLAEKGRAKLTLHFGVMLVYAEVDGSKCVYSTELQLPPFRGWDDKKVDTAATRVYCHKPTLDVKRAITSPPAPSGDNKSPRMHIESPEVCVRSAPPPSQTLPQALPQALPQFQPQAQSQAHPFPLHFQAASNPAFAQQQAFLVQYQKLLEQYAQLSMAVGAPGGQTFPQLSLPHLQAMGPNALFLQQQSCLAPAIPPRMFFLLFQKKKKSLIRFHEIFNS